MNDFPAERKDGGIMQQIRFVKIFGIVALFCIAAAVSASAQTLTTLVNFPKATDGYNPVALTQGTDGNIYGITYYGGAPTSCGYSAGTGCGTFFKMTPAGKLTILYNFCTQANCTDGSDPVRLIQGSNGNFYGVTQFGGVSTTLCTGCGTVFEITPTGKLTTLYSFCAQTGCPDGSQPLALVQTLNGNFYGVTGQGGANDSGTVFELTPTGKLTTLYTFSCPANYCATGGLPDSLMQAASMDLYGTTDFGGTYNGGIIFELSLAGKFTVLDSVHRANPLIQAGNRDLYGTTQGGGSGGKGTVLQMTPGGKLTTLHSFCSLNCPDGDAPVYGVAEGNDGNFYGTTYYAGNTYYAGSVYQITPTGTFTTLYSFCSQTNCTDGWGGRAIMQATSGEFYGTTAGGGTHNGGTVFSLSMGLGPFVAARPNFGSAGQTVTILGNNLTGTSSVTFNGTAATFTVGSGGTYIMATIPSGATPGTIEVTTPSGTLNSNIPFQVLP
jgi:uncharacterized repeat protein (TIGR03803 family)